ncbi:MAG TPA: N-acetylmuramoyl-L-alanine amidase [bacterium]|nr:N-acetylmuramoyl-L-alanine amidase [bacterium]
MPRAILAASALLVVAGCGAPEARSVAAAPQAPTAPDSSRSAASPFADVYAEASAASGVPAEVLRAVAQTQTAEHVVAESEAGQFGLMGLTEATIAEVAPHLHATVEQVKYDTGLNVRAAAWKIADARARGLNWNAAALSVADLSSDARRASWVQKFNRAFTLHGGAPPEEIAPDDATFYMDSSDYGSAHWVPASSSNYTASTRTHTDLYYVVIHDTEGSYDAAISWFENPASQVSAHFVTANTGDLTQMVKIADIAWHAGNWDYNVHSVGIEHEGYAADPTSYTEPQYEASATLTRWLCDTFIISRDRQHILGHVEIPGSTHHDPGPYWDWDHYMELVNAGAAAAKATLVGYVRAGDIYTGTPIVGATVTIDGGLTATTDANGYYEFDNLDLGTYTVTATAPGYAAGVDSKVVDSASTFWKSIALEASTAGGTPTPTATPAATPGANPDDGGGAKHGGCDVVGLGDSSLTGSLLALGSLAALLLRRR